MSDHVDKPLRSGNAFTDIHEDIKAGFLFSSEGLLSLLRGGDDASSSDERHEITFFDRYQKEMTSVDGPDRFAKAIRSVAQDLSEYCDCDPEGVSLLALFLARAKVDPKLARKSRKLRSPGVDL